jgi:hypothetical protein
MTTTNPNPAYNKEFWDRSEEEVVADLMADDPSMTEEAARASYRAMASITGEDATGEADMSGSTMTATRIEAPPTEGGGDPSPNVLPPEEKG